MKVDTLVYVRERGRTLMVHRVKKAHDMHAGKWSGLSGKLEPGETPEMCARRALWEESGLVAETLEWRGLLTFPAFAHGEDWLAFVFVAREISGALINSDEGDLAWIHDSQLLTLPLWAGDRICLHWLDREPFFSARITFVDGDLRAWDANFYGPGGALLRHESSRTQTAAEASVQSAYRYSEAEDACCWVCGGAVAKRHCKITCLECGFMRDCSDP